MKLFDVYPLYDLTLVKGRGLYVYDTDGNKYLDLYGGHAVISIGHSHAHYVEKISKQVKNIGFYSNSVINPLQKEMSQKLGKLSGYDDYNLFLCNSGAEANENALKLASFKTQNRRIIAFENAFHGRTSATVSATANPKIIAPVNRNHKVTFLPLNNSAKLEIELSKGDVCAVIIESILGIGGIHVPEKAFIEDISRLCKKYNCVFIADEIQSGYGRSGKFFAHQYTSARPDIITIAKGMGNGFPVGGVIINSKFEAWHGMLGTTFGGNHLACAAGIAVLDIIEKENLIENANEVGTYLKKEIQNLNIAKDVRGLGLMLGIEFDFDIKQLRKRLLFEEKIFTGVSGKNIIRLLPPLNITKKEADMFLNALKKKVPTKKG